ncbi:MAG: metallophosphoesterase [Nanoarchaeota archaeon]
MIKFLVLGDFHGKFSKKFEIIIKREKIDLVVSVGDYVPFHYRKLWFKHCFGKDIGLWEIIGKKKYKELILKDLNMAEVALRSLNKLHVLVFTVLGNTDYPLADDVMDEKKKRGKEDYKFEWDRPKLFLDRLKKYRNIRRFDYSHIKFNNIIFIGMRGHSFPGRVKSKAYKKHNKILNDLFNKFKKENKKGKVIFVSHIPPINTRLDKIGTKAHKRVRGTHRGSKLVRRIIERHQPLLHLCGHVHESCGKDNIGKTLTINVGSAYEGQGVLIELDENKGKISYKRIPSTMAKKSYILNS